MTHLIVIGNEKGGTGKSTTTIHLAVAMAYLGRKVGVIDLDRRQRTSARYIENRLAYARAKGLHLPGPDMHVPEHNEGAEGFADLTRAFAQLADHDVVLVDTPGRDLALTRQVMSAADTLITPINDSFVDLDLIAHVDAESFKVQAPSFFAETVWEARKARLHGDGKSIDWILLRNRLSHVDAHNRQRVGRALEELSRRIGLRIAPGLSERVIYRELFPRGLTLLDMAHIPDARMGHVAARAELRAMLDALKLPCIPADAGATDGHAQDRGGLNASPHK